ncbi:MAG: class F sortase [Chloroflexota bacterium]|nr:class F sortase [Chloroflexota bacterium]
MHVTRQLLQSSLLVISLCIFPQTGLANSPSFELPQVTSPGGGDLQAGPLGLNPTAPEGDVAQLPVAIMIPDASVDAEVKQNQIVDGLMLDPSGPWVVSWYEETSPLGEQGNSVMAGHLDYWDVGPAVFYDLASLGEEDEIEVTGDAGDVFSYQVTWTRLYQLEELNGQTISDIVGPTPVASLTLITCGGEFDEATGQYLSRYVVRAELTSST